MVAPRPIITVRQPRQPLHLFDDDEQKVEVGQCAVLTNLWLTALNQLQPTYVRCPEGKPSWLPDLLA
jgi:hypothetical protein